MKTFRCAWVENMLSIEPDGYSRPCCGETSISSRIDKIENGILNSFNHKTLLDLRHNLENGFNDKTRPFCNRCENLEIRGQSSLRTNTYFLSEKRELKLLQFKLSNKCQLACFHCGPSHSSTYAKKFNITPRIKKAFEINDVFLKELVEILPNLSKIKFTGGEPFLDPDHWKILDYLKDIDRSHCELEYITNGISPFQPRLWEGWKSVKCCVSVDGYEETYEWFRRGSSWGKVVSGVEKLRNYTDVTISYSLTPFTVNDYIKAKAFWNYKIVALPIVTPNYSSLINFPKSIIEKIKGYEQIPFDSYSDNYDLDIYVTWANKWDHVWNTPGWAERLFFWVKDFNDRNKTDI